MKTITREEILKAKRKAIAEHKKGLRYYDKKHNTYNPAWRSENILEHVSDLLGLFGVESFDPNDSNPSIPKYSYVNSGDSYCLTLIFNRRLGKFIVGDIGSIIERESRNE